MKNENKLTWSNPNGTWGLKNYDIKKVPGELQGALYKLHDYEKTDLSPNEVETMKEDFSPAEAAAYLKGCTRENTGWIPCSKRLPEEPPKDEYKLYNVTVEGDTEATTLGYVAGGIWIDDFGTTYNVIAWQPLPEPYIPEGGRQHDPRTIKDIP